MSAQSYARHTVKANGATITGTYRLIDLLVQQELSSAPTASPNSVMHKYAGKLYCTLTLVRNGSETEDHYVNDSVVYQQAITYLNTGIAADAFLASSPRNFVAAIPVCMCANSALRAAAPSCWYSTPDSCTQRRAFSSSCAASGWT